MDAAVASLPVDAGRIREAIAQQIRQFGMDKLTSRIIREKLKETFHADFSAHKAIIDKITMEVVEDGEKGEEQEKSEATDEGEAAAKTGESSSESDNVFTDRAPRKRAGASRKGAKVTRKRKSSESESELLEVGQRKRRAAVASRQSARKKSRGGEGSESVPKLPRKRRNGYTVYCALSDDLAAVCGARYMRRCDVIKTLWDYFKSNNLLDPKDRRYVLPDEPLKKIFKSKRFLGFAVMKDLFPHIIEPKFLDEEERAALEQYQAEQEAKLEAEENEATGSGSASGDNAKKKSAGKEDEDGDEDESD